MRINYNESAIIANNALNRTDNRLSDSIQRLSSGLKINYAKDNPAGIAIANRMDSQVRGIGIASTNTSDGVSVVETADGAMEEITSIIQRMNQLAVQAADSVKTDEDRAMMNEEIKQLKEEISRIAKDTQFNGQTLLNGNFDLKGYTDNIDVKVETYSDEVPIGKYTVDIAALKAEDATALAGMAGFTNLTNLKVQYDDENSIATITANGDFEIKLSMEAAASGSVELDITGIGAMKIQIGANEGQELAIRIPTISLKTLGIENMDLTTEGNASSAIEQLKGALNYVNSARAKLGAYQNRLEHNASNLAVSDENMTSAYSRIMDVDMATETTEYTTQQVLSQAGVSMLSQANARPEQILQLLQ
ncbi:MAG: flagellin [Lachnospiraceae bacterium]